MKRILLFIFVLTAFLSKAQPVSTLSVITTSATNKYLFVIDSPRIAGSTKVMTWLNFKNSLLPTLPTYSISVVSPLTFSLGAISAAAFVPFSGAISDVNLNSHILSGVSTFTSSGMANINLVTVGRGTGSNNASNVVLGSGLIINTTGANNTAIGAACMSDNSSGQMNTGVGESALSSNSTASNNTGVGQRAGQNTTTGGRNVFIGRGAGNDNITGFGNVYIGNQAGIGFPSSWYKRLAITDTIDSTPLVYGNLLSDSIIINGSLKITGNVNALTNIASPVVNTSLTAVASATTLTLTATNSYTVTGTTTITGLVSVGAGAIRNLVFTTALQLTHNGTSFILPKGLNITTGANDVATFLEVTTGNWILTNYSRASGFELYETKVIQLAASDETTSLTTGTAKVTFRMPYAMTITSVRGSVTTAATGATLLAFDVKESGTTIFSTKPTFDATELTTQTAATPSVLSDTSLADDASMTINIDAVGNTIAGAGLKVSIIGYVIN